jgi:hypothetical protein
MYIILGIIWYLSGVASFIYWWTSEFDIKSRQVLVMLLALCAGLFGPISFIFGFIIHGEPGNPGKVLIKKREK